MSPAVPPCHAWLIPQADPDQPVEIVSGVCIGRKDSCRIKIASTPTISAVQCEVKWNPQEQCFQLIDRSSNGTFLNGRLVTPRPTCPTRLADGDQVQLTKSWQQNLALQFTFVTSVVKLGGSVKVKQPKDSDEQIESLVGENGENHADQGSHDVAADLQKTLEELEAYNLSLSTQLMEAKEQLRKAESKVGQPDEVKSERIKLLAQVDEALKETAREEGIGSANRELIDECHKVHENLQMQLKELILQRDPLGHEKRRCEENTTACRAVERRVRDMTAAKEADIKDLHQQAQGLVFDINVHGTQCLSQCAVPENEDEVKLEADPIPPAKRCRVEVLSIDGVFAETIALG